MNLGSLGSMTMFSGMENAFHLGVWGLFLTAVLRLEGRSLSRAAEATDPANAKALREAASKP